jgi:hypothetical protein
MHLIFPSHRVPRLFIVSMYLPHVDSKVISAIERLPGTWDRAKEGARLDVLRVNVPP